MSKIRRLSALLMMVALGQISLGSTPHHRTSPGTMSPAASHAHHSMSSTSQDDAPAHRCEAPSDESACDHETPSACATMSSCVTSPAEAAASWLVAAPSVAADIGHVQLAPLTRTRTPESPPPRA